MRLIRSEKELDTVLLPEPKRIHQPKRKRASDPVSQCTGKVGYTSYTAAEREVNRCKRRFPLMIYRCRVCNRWHVGGDETARRVVWK